MDIILDIDGTVCPERPMHQHTLVKPFPGAVEAVNRLHKEGHKITFYTARGWVEYDLTLAWLKKYKFKFDKLLMAKPIGDLWVDDRAIGYTSWKDVLKKISKHR